VLARDLAQNLPATGFVAGEGSALDALVTIRDHVIDAARPVHVHLFSHGRQGALLLGTEGSAAPWLDAVSLEQDANVRSTLLSLRGKVIALSVYGCRVALGAEGERFVALLSALLAAPVAASSTVTGHAELGGDWALEVLEPRAAQVPASLVLPHWRGTLGAFVAPLNLVQEFFVPLAERSMQLQFPYLSGNPTDNRQRTFTSVVVTYKNTIIIWDHWEDGYEAVCGTPVSRAKCGASCPCPLSNGGVCTGTGSTEIWGDGDPTNGFPPSFRGVDNSATQRDTLLEGDVITIVTTFPNVTTQRGFPPSTSTTFYYDGNDRFCADGPLAVTRGSAANTGSTTTVPQGDFTLQGCTVEVPDLTYLGSSYVIGVGADVTNAANDLTRCPAASCQQGLSATFGTVTLLLVQALEPGTSSVTMKNNCPGTTAKTVTFTLSQGQSWGSEVDFPRSDIACTGSGCCNGVPCQICVGATVIETSATPKNLQVDVNVGTVGAWGCRTFLVRPLSGLSTTYVSPIASTTTDGTNAVGVVHNPGTTPITAVVSFGGTTTTYTLSIAAGRIGAFVMPTAASAASRTGAKVVCSNVCNVNVGADLGDSSVTPYDWSLSLPPSTQLTEGVVVGYGVRLDPAGTCTKCPQGPGTVGCTFVSAAIRYGSCQTKRL
jgi:hypothetical protein